MSNRRAFRHFLYLFDLFKAHELDYEADTCTSISLMGKVGLYNDTPVNLEILKTFALKLMDIHSQHRSLNLENHQYQLEVLDQFLLIPTSQACRRPLKSTSRKSIRKLFGAIAQKRSDSKV